MYLKTKLFARVVDLVDTLALGASAFGRGGSSPLSRTKEKRQFNLSFFFGTAELEHPRGRLVETLTDSPLLHIVKEPITFIKKISKQTSGSDGHF